MATGLGERGGTEGAGRCEGSRPIVATGAWTVTTIAVAATTAVSDSGIPRCNRGRPTMSTATTPTTDKVRHAEAHWQWVSTVQAATRVR